MPTRELVPTRRLSPLIEEYFSRPDNTYESLETLTGVPTRRLYNIRYMKAKSCTFETADKILTGLGLVHLWHVDLKDLYRL